MEKTRRYKMKVMPKVGDIYYSIGWKDEFIVTKTYKHTFDLIYINKKEEFQDVDYATFNKSLKNGRIKAVKYKQSPLWKKLEGIK